MENVYEIIKEYNKIKKLLGDNLPNNFNKITQQYKNYLLREKIKEIQKLKFT